MKKIIIIILRTVAKVVSSIVLYGVIAVSNTAAYATGDVVAGEEKSTLCASCHGDDGNSITGAWPNLAGQQQNYLLKQMQDFQQGEAGGRYSATMTALVTDLTQQDMEDIAAYYASQTPIIGAADPALVTRGQQIYRGGNIDKKITACSACHGPQGEGNADAGFPALAGQQPEYVIAELLAYKQGQRHNDLNHIMQDIAERMDKEDMIAVASYIYGLH